MADKEKIRKTKVGKFLQKVTKAIPDAIPVVADLTDNIPGVGQAFGLLDNILEKEKHHKQEAMDLLKEFRQNREDFQKELIEFHAEDIANARQSNVEIQNSQYATTLAKHTPYIIDMLITATWIVVTIILILKAFNKVSIEVDWAALAGIYAAVSSMMTSVLQFHRGSSMGSKMKDFNKNNYI